MHASSLQGVLDYFRKLTDPARPRELSDADLLERFRLGREEAAFTLLMQRHGPMVLAVCRRILGDVHEAEDAFQATFLVLVRKAGTIRKQQSLAGWLHRVASHIAHKAAMRCTRHHVGQAFQPDIRDDPSETLAAAELRAALDEEIERLPDKYRTPLVLCCLAEKTHEQAAAELGWPKSSVTARLARARELLQRRLIRRGFTAPAGLLAALLTEQVTNAAIPSLLALSTVRLAVQTLAGETLTATSAAALAGSFVKGTMALKLGATLALLATLGFAAVGYRMAVSRFPSQKREGAVNAQTAGERREAESQPPKPRVDLYGDPLPDGVVARIGSGRMRHFSVYGDACPLAFTPDCQSVVSGGRGGLRIWDAATGKLRRRFNFETGAECCLAFAFQDDGIRAASTKETKTIIENEALKIVTIYVFDPASGKVRRRMEMPNSWFLGTCPVFSPDVKRSAGASLQDVRIYDSATGRETLRIPREDARGITFAPDGKTIAFGNWSGTVYIHDTTSGKSVRELQLGKDYIDRLAFSPDGRSLACSSRSPDNGANRGQISVWDLATGKERHRPNMPSDLDFILAFSPDSKHLAACGRHHSEVILWDMATGKEVRRYPIGRGGVLKMAFSPDGKRLATRSVSGAIQLWDVATARILPASVDPMLKHIDILRFSSDGRRLLGFTDRYLIAWEPASGREMRRTAKPPDSPRDLALSPDESLLAGADPKGTIRLWAAATGRFERALNGHQGKVDSFVFSPDSRRLASRESSKTIRVWDVANGRQLHQFNVKETKSMTFSPDGRWLASASPVGDLPKRDDPPRDSQIILWDLVSGREKSRFAPVRNKRVYRLAFSPNSRLLAAIVGDDRNDPNEVAVWDVANGTRLHILDGLKTDAWCVAFSPDGRMLAIGGSDGALILWELISGHRRHQFIGHEDRIWSLAFSPDGRYLAAESADAPAFVWDVFGAVAAKQRRLSNDELQCCWNALAGNDAAAAFQSMHRLAAAPDQALPLLRQHLKPVPAADNKPVRRLVEMLDSDDFATRQKAAEELEKQADAGLLRQIAASEKPSLEVRRRLEQILEGIKSNPGALRVTRAVEVLEWIATPQAVRLIDEWAGGAADARLTREAAAARRRLSH